MRTRYGLGSESCKTLEFGTDCRFQRSIVDVKRKDVSATDRFKAMVALWLLIAHDDSTVGNTTTDKEVGWH